MPTVTISLRQFKGNSRATWTPISLQDCIRNSGRCVRHIFWSTESFFSAHLKFNLLYFLCAPKAMRTSVLFKNVPQRCRNMYRLGNWGCGINMHPTWRLVLDMDRTRPWKDLRPAPTWSYRTHNSPSATTYLGYPESFRKTRCLFTFVRDLPQLGCGGWVIFLCFRVPNIPWPLLRLTQWCQNLNRYPKK